MRPQRAAQVVAVVADDASGDQLCAHLMRALSAGSGPLEYVGIGGPHMESAGAQILHPMEALHARTLGERMGVARLRRRVRSELLQANPALFIGIDAPEFNLDLAGELKAAGVPTVQYVTSAILGWPRSRILQARHSVSLLLTILPLEARVYSDARVPVTFVGHPFADALEEPPSRQEVRTALRVAGDAPVITLMPGHGAGALQETAELFLRAARKLAENVATVRFLAPFESLAARDAFEAARTRSGAVDLNLSLVIGHSLEAMAAADVVLAAGGAVTLEAALLKRPMVVVDASAQRSWWRRAPRMNGAQAALPNLLAGEAVVPEFAIAEATPQKLAEAVQRLLGDDAARARLDTQFERMRIGLRQNTAQKAVAAITPLLSGRRGPAATSRGARPR